MSFQFSDGQSEVTGDFSKLEALIADLKEKHYVDIGVFGTAVTSEGMPVAEYGAYNEFGSISRPNHPPKRSFIRVPLQSGQGKITNYVKKHAQQHLEAGDVKAIFEDIGIAGESVIQESFDSRGPGWPANTQSTIDKKGHDAPLIGGGKGKKDEGRDVGGLLRHSITHRVDK